MSQQDPDQKEFIAFLKAAIVPMLILKLFILYFGLNYSQFPGEGYGWGLAFTVLVSILSASVFIYRQTRKKSERPSDVPSEFRSTPD